MQATRGGKRHKDAHEQRDPPEPRRVSGESAQIIDRQRDVKRRQTEEDACVIHDSFHRPRQRSNASDRCAAVELSA